MFHLKHYVLEPIRQTSPIQINPKKPHKHSHGPVFLRNTMTNICRIKNPKSISCTLFLHCWCGILLCLVPVFHQTALCSAAGACTAWTHPGGERFFSVRSTSWTRLSRPPSAESETRQSTLISSSSSSSFFYPLK